jgi:lipoprotein-anchoring transpeptidase ErfK/SrfK
VANRRRKYSLPGGKGSKRPWGTLLLGGALALVGILVLVWLLTPDTPAPNRNLSAQRRSPPIQSILPPLPPAPGTPPAAAPAIPAVPVQVSTQTLRWEVPPPAPRGVQISTQIVAVPAPRVASTPVAQSSTPSTWIPRSPTNALETQIALYHHGINGGSIDGVSGAQTAAAIRAFQMKQGIEATGRLDRDTLRELQITHPPITRSTVTAEDIARIHTIPSTWLAKSQLGILDHESILELVAERARSHPSLIRNLNPSVDWSRIAPGTELVVPNAQWPSPKRAARVRVSLAGRHLRAFDERGRLLCHFPCSIGRVAAKRPVGDLHVAVAVRDPNYTFDPAVFPESAEGRALKRKLVLPPGPNNPVGIAWIGLSRPGYGIHGTPVPEQVGRTESHGCFRLANWNADYLRQMVWVGMPVSVEP